MEKNKPMKNQDLKHADVKISPPILTLIHIVLAYVLGWFVPLPFSVPSIARLFGFILVVIGFLFGVAAFVEFRRAHTTLDPHGSVDVLVTSGIYRFTRNPIYLGFLLMVIGLPLNSGTYWGIVMAVPFVITCIRFVIEKEEEYLEKKFGEAYTSYKSRVRRWV